MTLNQLNYFYQAAVLEHFNQAAEKLNISEPSLSRSIAALEQELGVALFEKNGRNVSLTRAGEVFLEHVNQILTDIRRAETKMHKFAANGGCIDIAYVSPLAKTYIPCTVRAFLAVEKNRNINFNFHQDITSTNLKGLKTGSYDLIFGSWCPDEPNIEFFPILKQELVAILPENHPLCEKEAIDVLDFADYPVLGYTWNSGLGKETRNFFKEHGVIPDFICESPDENGMASLVAQNFGIALAADTETIHRDGICIRPLLPQYAFSHNVYMAYRKGRYQFPAVQRFISFIKEKAKSGDLQVL